MQDAIVYTQIASASLMLFMGMIWSIQDWPNALLKFAFIALGSTNTFLALKAFGVI